jgi:hypothetical protein
MPPSPSKRILDYDSTFFQGMKSDSDPGQVPLGYYWLGINTINSGGAISCRPGYRCIITFPDGNLQGGVIYRPAQGLEEMVVVIDGKAYVAPYPFIEFELLPNIQLSPYAKQVYFAQATQSVERVSNDFVSKIQVIASKEVVFIQDGGLSAPAWYDGSGSGHVSGNLYETPAGSCMIWVGDRLWVSVEDQVFASDISNPFSFRESDYLGGQVSFFFRTPVTAMAITPSIEAPQLMVFTESSGSILQANIRDRATWNSTPNFQEEVIGVGCVSDRSVKAHYGALTWYSPAGVCFYDPATSGKLTTRLPVRDNEMMFSKATLSEDLSLVAGGVFGQYLMMSVPAEDVYNRHTWVLNHASLETLTDKSGPSWMGYWIGTRPVVWLGGQIANTERIYHLSVDYDGKNRLWEAFLTDRLDCKCPITWGVLSRGYFGATGHSTEKTLDIRCRLQWVEFGITAIEEDINIGVFYAPGTRGAFRPMLNRLISVERGSLRYDTEITAESLVYAFKAQARELRTEDANQQISDDAQGACNVESQDQDNIDHYHQLLIVCHGPATIKWIAPSALLVPEDTSGEPSACEDEVPLRAVRFDGVGMVESNFDKLVTDLAAIPLADYTSQKTITLEEDDYLAVGVGYGESVVSQAAADRVAEIVATKMAENELINMLPVVTSIGLGLPVASYYRTLSGGAVTPSPAPDSSSCPPVLFTALANGIQWTPYSEQMGLVDWGTAPYTFAQASGGLPNGLTISPTGLVSGMPYVTGAFLFEVRVRDASGLECTRTASMIVSPGGETNVAWSSLIWGAPVVSGGFSPSLTVSGTDLSYYLHGSTAFTGFENANGSVSGSLRYTGSDDACELRLTVTNAGNGSSNTCSLHIQVLQDGVSLLDVNTSTPSNPAVGFVSYPFTVLAGVDRLIEVKFTGFSAHGNTTSQAISGSFWINNL